MTKTEELLKLAEAAMGHRGLTGAYVAFIDEANPTTIKQLVELVRMQHEALVFCKEKFYITRGTQVAPVEKAIAAFEEFEK